MASALNIDTKQDIAIYGAGQYARQIYDYLWALKILKNVRFVIVSDQEEIKEPLFFDIPVFHFGEKKKELRNLQVIVAVSERKSGSILETLSENGICNIITVKKEFINGLQEEYIRIFCSYPIDRNKVFFDAYNGSGYTCNSKYIAEELMKQRDNLEIIWDVLAQTKREFPQRIKPVIFNSVEYFHEVYTAGVLVFNATINSRISCKRPEQYWIDTWHGIGPFKKVGKDIDYWKGKRDQLPEYDHIRERVDLMLAASDHCEGVYRNSMGYRGEIQKWGYPRNDVMFHPEAARKMICKLFDINPDKKIVLYAPTYRYDVVYDKNVSVKEKYYIDPAKILESLQKRYGDEFVFMYRFHHIVYKFIGVEERVFEEGIDATFHPDMNELLASADVLITDYSSSMWDFSLARSSGKRVFLYHNDEEKMEQQCGFYLPPHDLPFPKGRTIEELCAAIESYNEQDYMRSVDAFFEKYGSYDDGHAAERVVDRILDVIDHPEKYGKA